MTRPSFQGLEEAPSRFWSSYERMEKQHDDEFLERHNGVLDVLLIDVVLTVSHYIRTHLGVFLDLQGWSFLSGQLHIHCQHGVHPDSLVK